MERTYTENVKASSALLGLLGLLGFSGIPVFMYSGMTFPFLFFGFFGFFGLLYRSKMSNILIDERYVENRNKAMNKAIKFVRIMLVLLVVVIGALESHLDEKAYMLIVVEVFISIIYAGFNFLVEYYTYKLDSDEEA